MLIPCKKRDQKEGTVVLGTAFEVRFLLSKLQCTAN